MMVIEVIFLSLMIIGCLVAFVLAPRGEGISVAVIATVLFIFFVGHVAPKLGVGRVPGISEQLTLRLGRDRIYEVLSSTTDHGDLIILVREVDDPQVFALRIKGPVPPPRNFVLVGGRAIEVAR